MDKGKSGSLDTKTQFIPMYSIRLRCGIIMLENSKNDWEV